MQRFGFGFVVGVIVLLIGASIAIDVLFGIHFPLLPLAFAILLIALGTRMMARGTSRSDRGDVRGEAWLADRRFTPAEVDSDRRYDVIFGRGVIDLTHVVEPLQDVTISVDTVFGASVVKLDPAMAVEIVGNSMFGEVRMPDRTMTAMGGITYRSTADHVPRLHLRLNTVFGSCQVVSAT